MQIYLVNNCVMESLFYYIPQNGLVSFSSVVAYTTLLKSISHLTRLKTQTDELTIIALVIQLFVTIEHQSSSVCIKFAI
jgi:hypothetical protein